MCIRDRIYFGTLSGGTTPAGSGAMGAAAPAVVVDKVEKARGADARTVAEAWAQREQLNGKTVTIRAVVVKYNEGVMGRNWIHLQDGSSDATKGTNDITVTSMDGVAMGATVTITGTVHINKDFGAGYSYAVIVEDAKVAKPSDAPVAVPPLISPLSRPASDDDLRDLAALLVDAVEAGAAVSFLPPLAPADAIAWWQETLAGLAPRAVVLVARDAEGIVATVQFLSLIHI